MHPRTLLELGPLARTATPEDATAHDSKTAEAARYKLGRLTADDPDGYHRVQCPAAIGKMEHPEFAGDSILPRSCCLG